MQPDPRFKKTVTLRQGGQRLELAVAQDLFSSFEVDVGTRLLLRTLAGADHRARRRVLDLGCGYGPIGLGLKSLERRRVVHMVDRDALAVDYARGNAERNGFDDVQVYGSLGYDDVRAAGFDLIASNLPAKAGRPVIEHLLLDAADHLRPGGLVAVVVVAPLAPTVAAILDGHPGVTVVHRRATAGYAVFHYHLGDPERPGPPGRPGGSALARGVYDRGRVALDHGGIRLTLRTAHGLPEFDTLSFQSELAADALLRLPRRAPGGALVLNPGQGHVPAILWKALQPGWLRLVDRDLLALRYSQANLIGNGCPAERVTVCHRADPAGEGAAPADLIVALLRPKEPPEAAATTVGLAAAELAPGGRLVVAATSTAVTRCLAVLAAGTPSVPLAVRERKRAKGFSVAVLDRA